MGSTHPYYRRRRPEPQLEADFLRDLGLRWIIERLKGWGALQVGAGPEVHVRALMQQYPALPRGSVRAWLANLLIAGEVSPHIDLENARIDAYGVTDPVAATRSLLAKREAAAIFAHVSPHLGVRMAPIIEWAPLGLGILGGSKWPFHVNDVTGKRDPEPGVRLFSLRALLEMKFYGAAAPTVYHPTAKSLAAMAYADYFPSGRGGQLRSMVDSALLTAAPGWCGTFGPGVKTSTLIFGKPLEGNYDMAQQHLLRIAYAYFDELSRAAREHLVHELLARGRIFRVNLDDTFTSGRAPNDWSRGGAAAVRIGETENHLLLMMTARYLTNQLMYQRHREVRYDNRRNGSDDAFSCFDIILFLLRNILLDDFSEYNAKPYQHETRTALLNLFNFAYDHEVRLAARMVLDYVSARMAVSSNDCRRMVPFRRRNESTNVSHTSTGRMTVGLLEWQRGADPMTEHMAMLSGATRAYDVPSEPHRPLPRSIASGGDATFEMLSDYRMPAPIHDLFVNDRDRRFFQMLRRRELPDINVTGRNATHGEMSAGSPSYLITAGGAPAPFAIDPYVVVYLPSGQDQQRGVSVPSSFMPTGDSAGNNPDSPEHATIGYEADAVLLIQVGKFSQAGPVLNFGVAPDFLCGPYHSLPRWCIDGMVPQRRGKFDFVNKRGPDGHPGFYLAILRDGDFVVIEAHDTWLHPELEFEDFKAHVWARNAQLSAHGLWDREELTYTTENGNRIRFMMWGESDDQDVPNHGALINDIEWSGKDPTDQLPEDGAADYFLRGSVLNSAGDGLIRITNPFLHQTITLDMRDARHPRRVSELNQTEAAGANQEVWVDFDWRGVHVSEGDFFRPFRTLAEGVAKVAEHGLINIMPGVTSERGVLNAGKRLRLHAPIGGVRIG